MEKTSVRAKLGVFRRCISIIFRRPRLGVHVWIPSNSYSDMLYRQFTGANAPHPMTYLAELDAFSRLGSRDRVLWIHSEASYSWGCAGDQLAAAHRSFLSSLDRWSRKGGTLIWTVHDDGLHLNDPNTARIAGIRDRLRKMADCVHVHSQAAKALVIERFGVDRESIIIAPHPSYAPLYPCIPALKAEVDCGPGQEIARNLLSFGNVKRYKNYDYLAAALDALGPGSFAGLTIAGKIGDDTVLPAKAFRRNVTLDMQLRYIPDAEVPLLFAEAHFLVLPYTESLTSAAAALAMGFGVPVIAPDLGGMRESVPEDNWPLIYPADDPDGLANALRQARDMSAAQYRALRDRCRDFGVTIHPDRVSAKLIALLEARSLLTAE